MNHLKTYLKKELYTHFFDYLLLVTAGIFFLIILNSFRGERFLEFFIVLLYIFFYIIWGVYHHLFEDSLHLKNVVEYILIGFTILFLLKILILP
ncbi:hypothetical protein CO048_02800 [Candidatus Roizmanbacteria bacterium CG_4_9_14_0_2_um_filter_35_15]|uniref:Uncharacterized protein n=1 Tax=Candidatus Roizmanbacteria bacterium CG_4_9_14_0_2_um_filter_35_15 TaxID=1974836 RepID=A0A2M8F2T3_9BACT|nr:MAG: hypothetical protein CO048_02800 [Candidatus Roizmanbacteria bacterium CG_4_9_14_0_2_um_filter_35_15]